MSQKLIFNYGISYPIEDHEDILKLLPEEIKSGISKTIRLCLDNNETPNRGFIYVIGTHIDAIRNGNGSTYINFYPTELKKVELINKAELSELNMIYDKLIVEFLPETFHLGWSAFLSC